MTDGRVRLANGVITVGINPFGAELSSLRDCHGTELLWQPGAAYARQAPILFPIIGRMPDDTLRHNGNEYPITQHGFARDHQFRVMEAGPTSAAFALEANLATLAQYPFTFRLEIRYEIHGNGLASIHTLYNLGTTDMYASTGAHPAFNWPLGSAPDRLAHRIEFLEGDTGPTHHAPDNLLNLVPKATPVVDRVITLDDSLFDKDVVVFSAASRRKLRYGAPGHQHVTIDTGDFNYLGLWAPPRKGSDVSPLLCIEPWSGLPPPVGFAGEIKDKPSQILVQPGTSSTMSYRIHVHP